MQRWLRITLYVGAAVVVAALLAYAFVPPAAEVDVARVSRGTLEVTVSEDGKTRIKERYIVSAPLSGELLRVDLHPGDAVRAGETVVAVIEPSDPSLLDARSQAEAEAVAAAEAPVDGREEHPVAFPPARQVGRHERPELVHQLLEGAAGDARAVVNAEVE